MADTTLDILAIGAHPDDIEMTSGGYLALAVGQGKRVGALHLTKGEMGTRGTPEERQKEAEAAAEVLGLSLLEFGGLVDGEVRANAEAVKVIVECIRKHRPLLVIGPNPICHHPDHEGAAEAVIRAVHFAGKVKYECEGDAHNVHGLLHARYSYPFTPSLYVDISSVIETKRSAIDCYRSQFVGKPGEHTTRLSNPGFVDQLLARGQATGLNVGCEHAEEYLSAGPLLIADPVDLFASQAALPTILR